MNHLTFRDITMLLDSRDGGPMAAISYSPSLLRRSSISKGGIAGAVVGSVAGLVIIFLLVLPFIKRARRNGRRLQHEEPSAAEMGTFPGHEVGLATSPPTVPHRVSSQHSPAYAQNGGDGGMGLGASKEDEMDGKSSEESPTMSKLPRLDTAASPRDSAAAPESETDSAAGTGSADPVRRQSAKGSLTNFMSRLRRPSTQSDRSPPASFGPPSRVPTLDMDILGPVASAPQQPIYTTGASAEYYSGVPMSPPELTESPRMSPVDGSFTGLIAHSLVHMSQTVADAPFEGKRSGTQSSAPLSPPGSHTTSPVLKSQEERGDHASPSLTSEAGYPPRVKMPSPPAVPAPGTVNPLDVWAPTGAFEKSHHTEAELDRIENSPSPPNYATPIPPPEMPAETGPFHEPSPPNFEYPLSPPEHNLDHMIKNETSIQPKALITPPEEDVTAISQTPGIDALSHPTTPEPPPQWQSFNQMNTPLTVPALSDGRNSASPGSSFIATPGPQQALGHGRSPSQASAISVSSPQTFACDECGRIFDQVHKLNHHKRYHERPHQCTYSGCEKRFGTKTHLDRHINDKHNKVRKYHCTQEGCSWSRAGGKSFPRKDNWRRHMQNKHGYNPEHDPIEVIDETMTGM